MDNTQNSEAFKNVCNRLNSRNETESYKTEIRTLTHMARSGLSPNQASSLMRNQSRLRVKSPVSGAFSSDLRNVPSPTDFLLPTILEV
jgi:hypothetical protein